MKFIVDAHLPIALCEVLRKRGFDAVHTRELPEGNATSDQAISELSVQQQRVVISKDSDFYYSHLLQGRPARLILVRTGNIGKRQLVTLFETQLDVILRSLETGTLVEVHRTSVEARR